MRAPARRGSLRPSGLSRAIGWSAAVALALGLAAPGTHALRLMSRSASIVQRRPPAFAPRLKATSFAGDPAAGALFDHNGSRLGAHFCTASVVDSAHRNLVLTAAHCVAGMSASQIAYVPRYHNGRSPFGVWTVTRIIVDKAWRRWQDPNDDFAFLVVSQEGKPAPIQDVTGGERLGLNWRQRVWVHVLGYPDQDNRPIICQARTRPPRLSGSNRRYDSTQMQFDCGGYADGTSGGPFLARYSYRTRTGTVIGVIGGFEQGGYVTSVSYSARFGRAMSTLYRAAVRDS